MISSTKMWSGLLIASVACALVSVPNLPGWAAGDPCGETSAPTCNGTCPYDEICVSTGSSCECLPQCGADMDFWSLTNSTAPLCSGACPAGQVCRPASHDECNVVSGSGSAASECASEAVPCACVPERGIVNSMLKHQR